jgi:hypothetical protein
MNLHSSAGRGTAAAGTAMFLVGTLTAVSATISHYPVFGGQAVRYTVAALMRRLAIFVATLVLVCTAAAACSHADKEEHLKVADDKKLSDGLDAFFYKIIKVLDAGKPATALTGGPAPCDQYELKYFEGGSSPYKIAGFSSIDDIPPNKSVPAVMRLKAYAERSGWKISAFRPATGSRMSTELAGHDSHSGYGFSVEALHDVNRIVISVGSDCVRDPRDHRGKVPHSSY